MSDLIINQQTSIVNEEVVEKKKYIEPEKKIGKSVSVFFWKGKLGNNEVVFQMYDSVVNYQKYLNFLPALNEARYKLFGNLPYNSGTHKLPKEETNIYIIRINATTGSYSDTEIKTVEQAEKLILSKQKQQANKLNKLRSVEE